MSVTVFRSPPPPFLLFQDLLGAEFFRRLYVRETILGNVVNERGSGNPV
jgi:hypothetical protein